MKKLKVYPVLLEGNDKNLKVGDIIKCHGTLAICESTEEYGKHHLYLVSDKEIKEGWKGIAYKSDVVGKIFKHFYTTNTWYNDAKIVEATTDPSLNLPIIPKSFIEKYVEEQGKVEIYLALWEEGVKMLSDNAKEIIILPVKDSWNKEEFKAEMLKAYEAGSNIYGDDFEVWFRENY